MKTSDFYYELPEELIAQHPLTDRSSSRLMTLDGRTGAVSHMHFSDLPSLLHKGDVLVINNTKVIPARLLGSRSDTGSAVELLLLKRIDENHWETLARPGKKIRPGKRMTFLPGKLEAECEDVLPDGNRIIRFDFNGIWEEILDEAGTMPLPPYIHEQLEDQTRYQTVYAKETGSAAAPTAGLHFTPELLNDLREMGIEICEVTLHVGLGTFRPVKVDDISDHHMHSEWYELDEKASLILRKARKENRRVIAVGTTSCRTLETVAAKDPGMHPCSGWTDIFIYPGVDFHCIDGLITNFHLPESTLIMLVSAFAGKEHVLNAYKTAVSEKYRFFSFGDAMFITPEKPRIKSPLEDQE
ncbi:MAG: tRNA preQ1(34) S-adenosylmethionine ribosyltransferase-isomerase QueA [Saccharofermentanaceae bacterium]|nr:tRNA preQ1(34) S-adenosylmethionine ribosyltransferase-isomerase QueA [Saccharofermentanaceae bacterium]HAU50689.1 tRNA preQ1(34) S-adenosylmethionine ribosyltransferase-isomerase QueA [Clostridiales bacterium]